MPIFKKRDVFPTQGHGLLALGRVVNIGEVPDEGLQAAAPARLHN
jgi:hypothetical protein